MIKKIILSILLLALMLTLAGCGGGSGSSSVPVGVNPSIAAIVQLLPVQYVVHTNSFITFKAKVLDGNGRVMQNVQVIFTNLSLTGVLSSTTANTDAIGIATVTLYSTTDGFSTVQAEVNTGSGQVRDKKTVFFTSSDLVLRPSLELDIIGGSGDPFTVFEDTTDNTVNVIGTLRTYDGQLVAGDTITFLPDVPYLLGPDTTKECSNGLKPCEVWFPNGNTAMTDVNGQATVLMVLTPIVLTDLTRVVNITASASFIGAFNMISLFLSPVHISSIDVFANPSIVGPAAGAGTSEITAAVMTTAGIPAPDGTTVNFTSTAGSFDTPFAQTTDGVATATLNTPPVADNSSINITVTASAGGVSGTTTVTAQGAVVAPPAPPAPPALAVGPATAVVLSVAPFDAITFTASGGTGPYVATSSCAAAVAFNDNGAGGGTANDGILNGTETNFWNTSSTFVVTVPIGAAVGTCTITVTDFVGATDTATITIQ